MRLVRKVAIVTGGGLGIGRATALRFAQEGAKVVVADISPKEGEETVRRIVGSGGEGLFVRTDVSVAIDAERMVKTAIDAFGRLDILFNNAGVYARGTVVETDEELWERMMAVNVKGIFLCSKMAIPHMISNGGGVIINISSSVGWHAAGAKVAAYVASKFAVTGLTKAMAVDHLRDNIRVNCICPGPTDTPLLRASRTSDELKAFVDTLPIGRLAKPEEISAAAVFFASDEASFVTGVTFPVDGGQTAHT